MRYFNFSCGYIVCSAIFLTPNIVRAHEASVVADAHVSSSAPAINFGSLPTLNVAYGSPALIAFDLSALPGGTTAANVLKANLVLFVNRISTPGQIEVQPVNSAWTESGITAAAMPVLGGSGSGVVVPVIAAQQFVAVDVTSLVKKWVANPNTNFGFALVPSAAAPSTTVFFDSKENTATGHVAQLEVVLSFQGAAAPIDLVAGAYGTDVCARSVTPTPGACPTGYTAVGIAGISFTSAVACQSDAGGDTPRVMVSPLCIRSNTSK